MFQGIEAPSPALGVGVVLARPGSLPMGLLGASGSNFRCWPWLSIRPRVVAGAFCAWAVMCWRHFVLCPLRAWRILRFGRFPAEGCTRSNGHLGQSDHRSGCAELARGKPHERGRCAYAQTATCQTKTANWRNSISPKCNCWYLFVRIRVLFAKTQTCNLRITKIAFVRIVRRREPT